MILGLKLKGVKYKKNNNNDKEVIIMNEKGYN